MEKINENDYVKLVKASKVYEDIVINCIGYDLFDDWLNRIPDNVDLRDYVAILYWLANHLRAKKQTKDTIATSLNVAFYALKYNPKYGHN